MEYPDLIYCNDCGKAQCVSDDIEKWVCEQEEPFELTSNTVEMWYCPDCANVYDSDAKGGE